MAQPLWPSTLPFFLANLEESSGDGAVRFQPDAGPALVRRRYSAVTTQFAGSMILRGSAQKAALDTFFHATLSEGVFSFHFPDPNVGFETGSATSTDDPLFRFLGPPSYTHLAGDGTGRTSAYRVSLSLEKLP